MGKCPITLIFSCFCDINYTQMIGKIYKQSWSINTVNIIWGKIKKSLRGKKKLFWNARPGYILNNKLK